MKRACRVLGILFNAQAVASAIFHGYKSAADARQGFRP